MAHEISFVGGRANAVYTKRPAWHELGIVYDEPPTLAQAKKDAVLDYEVEVGRVYIRKTTESGDEYFVPSKGGFHTFRTDTGQELGIVGSRYTPLQNSDAFRVLEPLIDNGQASIDAAFVLRDGADAVVVVKFDLGDKDPFNFKGDTSGRAWNNEVATYGMIANNHSGRRGVLAQVLPFRVECANMLGMAESRLANDQRLGRAVVVPHTASVGSRVVDAAEKVFGGIVQRFEVVEHQFDVLRQTALSEEAFRKLILDVVTPDPRKQKNFNPEAKLADLVVRRHESKATELRRLWDEGDGHSGDHSAWEAYNAVTQALDHNKELFPVRGGAYRTASLLDGTFAQVKGQVLNGLLEFAAK